MAGSSRASHERGNGGLPGQGIHFHLQLPDLAVQLIDGLLRIGCLPVAVLKELGGPLH
ncbi:MAG: hypothetical protein ACREYE_18535 [Gammaproteobacteria bacterium]